VPASLDLHRQHEQLGGVLWTWLQSSFGEAKAECPLDLMGFSEDRVVLEYNLLLILLYGERAVCDLIPTD